MTIILCGILWLRVQAGYISICDLVADDGSMKVECGEVMIVICSFAEFMQ